ncbi:glutamic acid-rich protein isoform X1 [Schistocerca cancellata]|uniref:glutamic acid-rich protein isoform X1 n=1 Tax=Schistocerca cancellata TaxID=274614 RepID=UPI0021186C2F|nr:glutamic acid-rich protein isoform X1 [Schistocerca cancellata]
MPVCELISVCETPNKMKETENSIKNILGESSYQDSNTLPCIEGLSLENSDAEVEAKITINVGVEKESTDTGVLYQSGNQLDTPVETVLIADPASDDFSSLLEVSDKVLKSETDHSLKDMPGNGSHFFTTIVDDEYDVYQADICSTNELQADLFEMQSDHIACNNDAPEILACVSVPQDGVFDTDVHSPGDEFNTNDLPGATGPKNCDPTGYDSSEIQKRKSGNGVCIHVTDSEADVNSEDINGDGVNMYIHENLLDELLTDSQNSFEHFSAVPVCDGTYEYPITESTNSLFTNGSQLPVESTEDQKLEEICFDATIEADNFDTGESISFTSLPVIQSEPLYSNVREECEDTADIYAEHTSITERKNVGSCVCDVASNISPSSSSSESDEVKESHSSSSSDKNVVKKKKSEQGDSLKKKTKKSKKSEKENISVKSSFSKFDQLSKKTVLHVRSVDASKVQEQFNQNATDSLEKTNNCRSCGKQVFQMEQIKAERSVWHNNCFRCKECNKKLTVDTYSSHEGQLYCKPHFKELFKPKAVLDEEVDIRQLRKPKLIICENEPVELPPEVVRASDKPDLGLEELAALNLKSRYQVFERSESESNEIERSPSNVSVKRSPSILSKLARFQSKGMDIGVTDDSLNGVPYEESSSSSEEEEEESGKEGTKDLIRASRKQRERPVSFSKMGDIKCRWETGHTTKKEEMREERKQEIQNIRSRLFMGKQGKMKEMYEQAVMESERSTQKKGVDICSERAKSLKEKFERGEVVPDDEEEDITAREEQHKKAKEQELSLVEAGLAKKSRSLFLELDATAKNQQPPLLSPAKSPVLKQDPKKTREALFTQQVSKDIVRASDTVEDVKVETSDVSSKFKFFETYKEPEKQKKPFRITPPREGQVKEDYPETEVYRDPNIVRSDDKIEEEIVRSKTTSKMLSLFRQLEENASKEDIPEGPKPLKRFTPPPDYTRDSETSPEESEDEDDEEESETDEQETNTNKTEDEILIQARNAARAKTLRAKFERWEEKENKLNSSNSSSYLADLKNEDTDQPSIESAKVLRAKFESLKHETEQPRERSRPKVNRFV